MWYCLPYTDHDLLLALHRSWSTACPTQIMLDCLPYTDHDLLLALHRSWSTPVCRWCRPPYNFPLSFVEWHRGKKKENTDKIALWSTHRNDISLRSIDAGLDRSLYTCTLRSIDVFLDRSWYTSTSCSVCPLRYFSFWPLFHVDTIKYWCNAKNLSPFFAGDNEAKKQIAMIRSRCDLSIVCIHRAGRCSRSRSTERPTQTLYFV